MARRKIQGTRLLVTGASSGIGCALAEQAALLGARVALTARSQERLANIVEGIKGRGGEAVAIAADVTDPSDRRRMLEVTVEQFGGLDILVNNAGVGATGYFYDASEDRLRRIMEVNFFGPAELTRLAIPILKDGHSPLVVNVGSVLGRRAMPGRCEYSASKFALTGLSEALRAELTRFDIDLLLVQPGLTVTPFEEHMLEHNAIYSFHKRRTMTPETLALIILRAMEKGKKEIVTTLTGKFVVKLNRLFPKIVDRVIRRASRRVFRRHEAEKGVGRESSSAELDLPSRDSAKRVA